MNIKSFWFKYSLLGILTSVLWLVPKVTLSHENQEQPNFPGSYVVDGYAVDSSTTRLVVVSPVCFDVSALFELPESIEINQALSQRFCQSVYNPQPIVIVPASIEGDIGNQYTKRWDYDFFNYPPQELNLILAFATLSGQRDRVVSVERRGQIITVEVESDYNSSQSSVAWGKLIQVELGYLEPGEYQVEIEHKMSTDGVLQHQNQESKFFWIWEPKSQ